MAGERRIYERASAVGETLDLAAVQRESTQAWENSPR